MKRKLVLGIVVVAVIVAVAMFAGCIEEPEITPTSTPMITPQRTIIVTSAADSGPGTLRQKLSEAQSGDKIIFDIAIFPSNAPNTIFLANSLPEISQGNITIDGDNAGVILDGSKINQPTIDSLFISSNGNIIQGLQIKNFPAAGILLYNCQNNRIENNLIINNKEDGMKIINASLNTIKGNLIGTDINGLDLGNYGQGINVLDNSNHNIIGPNNIIAYNLHGIKISENSIYNTITQNSIYNNQQKGIKLWSGGNTELSPPLIIDFDLDAGTLQGHTNCPNCKIEIFSDNNSEGEVYEGQTIVDNNGVFNFNKGASFTKSHITGTVTDNEGSTSQFSTPTSGVSKSITFQEGNNIPKTQLEPKESRELEDNRIGQMLRLDIHTEQEANACVYQNNNQLGLKWVRLTIDWFDWDEVANTGEYSRHYIDPYQDKAITDLVDNEIKIMYTLVYWDEGIQDELGEDYTRFKTEEEIQRYLNYVQFIVHNFKGRIEYYEILNEPNIGGGTQQYVESADYINLVKRATSIIRQEDPQAKIVVGAVTLFTEPGAFEYFSDLLSSDVMPLVNAVSWHAGGTSPEYMQEYYYNYPNLLQEINDIASAHGFEGEYIAEELHWRTSKDPHPTEYSEYGETASAKYYARGIVMHLGMDLTTGLALEELEELPLMVGVIRNLCTIMAGTEAVSVPIAIESEATNIKCYSFSLSNGDTLIALWTDGVAVDDDPGVKANLTFHCFTEQDVTGIGVLKGFQQPITTSNENGNLTIQNLIVRDYPMMLRIAKSSAQ